MTIERLSIPEGVPVSGTAAVGKTADWLLEERRDEILVLAPGEYDITPTIGIARGTGSDRLIVLDDGTGLFRIQPRGMATLNNRNVRLLGERIEKSAATGTQLHLSANLQRVSTQTEHHERRLSGIMRLVEIIRWTEGRSSETDDYTKLISDEPA